MQYTKINALLLAFTLSFSCSSHAQFGAKYAVGLNLGTFVYEGDLAPEKMGSWKTPGFVFGLTGLKYLTPTLAARLDLNFGNLRGDEAKYNSPEYRQYRAFAFKSRIHEIILAAEWSPLGREQKLSPYLFGGLAYASLKISRDYSRFNATYFASEPALIEALAKDAKTSLPKEIAFVPVGLGLKYALNRKFSLTAEASQRFTRNDFIDGFSYSGNPGKKDGYSKFSLGVRYSLGNTDPYACPTIRY